MTSKILICSEKNITNLKIFDKIIFTDYQFVKNSINYFDLTDLNVLQIEKKKYEFFSKILKKLDQDFFKTNKFKENYQFFFFTTIERCVKYSKIIEGFLKNFHIKNKKKYIFYLSQSDLKDFRFKFLYIYLKHFKFLNVKVVKFKTKNSKKFFFKRLNFFYIKILIFSILKKFEILFFIFYQKFFFIIKNLIKRELAVIILDNIKLASIFEKNKANYFYLEQQKYKKKKKFNISYVKKYNNFQQSLFNIIFFEIKSSLYLLDYLISFLSKINLNYKYKYLIYTFPPTIYDSFKSLIIQIAKKNRFKIFSVQHGGDYGYQKNFLSHFFKDFNNCDYFISFLFNYKIYMNNYKKIIYLFKTNFKEKLILVNKKKFIYLWNLKSFFSFFQEKQNINLFICSRYHSSLNEEMLNYEDIFIKELQIINQLVKKKEKLIVKLPEFFFNNYYLSIRNILRKDDLIIDSPGLKTLLIYFKNLKLYSATISTAHLEAKLLNKKTVVIKNSKFYYNKINSEIYKSLI
jgi:hypothetical protein